MAFTFSGFNLFNLMHVNHIAAVAHMPWLLLGTHVLLTSRDRRRCAWAFAGVALAVGSQLLVGNPQYVWLTLVVLGFMVLCLLYAGAPSSRVPLLLAAGMLGALIGAVQLLPTLDFARESTRVTWSQDQALSFSLSPLNVVQLWSPFAFQFRIHAPASEAFIVHEFIVYNGAFCTVALFWLALRWRQRTRRCLLCALVDRDRRHRRPRGDGGTRCSLGRARLDRGRRIRPGLLGVFLRLSMGTCSTHRRPRGERKRASRRSARRPDCAVDRGRIGKR